MYLTANHFEGDPAVLAAAHERMTAHFALGATDLHLCVTTGDGIVFFDGCPSREVAAAFQESAEFAHALASSGLPSPRTESIGEIVWSTVGAS